MVLGEEPSLELPTPASEFEFIFKMMDVVREERKFLNPPPTVSRGEHVLQPRKVPGGEKQPGRHLKTERVTKSRRHPSSNGGEETTSEEPASAELWSEQEVSAFIESHRGLLPWIGDEIFA